MKRNNLFEARRKSVSKNVRNSVSLSFDIVDRIHDILTSKGLKQKDLALLLGKSEAEISKWMRGNHNFTIETLMSIQNALNERIIDVVKVEYQEEPMRHVIPIFIPHILTSENKDIKFNLNETITM